jgi:aminoglycoside 6'-N-acetyltransferase I
MDFIVREMRAADKPLWAEMRHALWPEETAAGHATQLDAILESDEAWGFIVETREGVTVGFAELAIRKYANGCESQPVPFLEGIWIEEAHRRIGAGRALVAHIEAFVIARGFREIGSDAYFDNTMSHEAHRGWGFMETERVVYFRKRLAQE